MGLIRDLLLVLFMIVAAVLYFISEDEDRKTIANATIGGIVGGILGFIIGRV